MAKFFTSYYIVLIILFLFSSGTSFSTAKGGVCSEDLGPCDDNCNSKCTSKYPNGKGSGDSSSNSCKCYYECTSPPPPQLPPPPPPPQQHHNTCSSGIGRCGAACNDQCCNENCAAKYPGPLGGHGMCFSAISPSIDNICLCTYNC